jgi:hypothetical protein
MITIAPVGLAASTGAATLEEKQGHQRGHLVDQSTVSGLPPARKEPYA